MYANKVDVSYGSIFSLGFDFELLKSNYCNQLSIAKVTCQPKTSERRSIRMRADYYKFSRRGGSDQHVFRWYVTFVMWLLKKKLSLYNDSN